MPRCSYKNSRSRNTQTRYVKRRNVGRMSKRVRRRGGELILTENVSNMIKQYNKDNPGDTKGKNNILNLLKGGFNAYNKYEYGNTAAVEPLSNGLLPYYQQQVDYYQQQVAYYQQQFAYYKQQIELLSENIHQHEDDVLITEIEKVMK